MPPTADTVSHKRLQWLLIGLCVAGMIVLITGVALIVANISTSQGPKPTPVDKKCVYTPPALPPPVNCPPDNPMCSPEFTASENTCPTFDPTGGCPCVDPEYQFPPLFNWIISACGDKQCTEWQTGRHREPSRAMINYLAAYQFDPESDRFIMQSESSYNTDGQYHTLDLMHPENNPVQWLTQQPGGAGGWSLGFHPTKVRGVGPPAMLFVLSFEEFRNTAWFMLNQQTLNRGPDDGKQMPDCRAKGYNNGWKEIGNEIDFYESNFWKDSSSTKPIETVERFYVSGNNANQKCFAFSGGKTGAAAGGGNTSAFFDADGNTPHIIAAVVDRTGVYVYRDPKWVGLTSKTAAPCVPARPSEPPSNKGPPCCNTAPGECCAIFEPTCLDGGCCPHCKSSLCKGKSVFLQFVDTKQYRVDEAVYPTDAVLEKCMGR